MIPRAAAQKVPNVITFFDNRRGMSDAEATANCVEGLNRVKKIGEDSLRRSCSTSPASRAWASAIRGRRSSP